MIRVFKHYVPNAVALLGVIDFGILLAAAELGWLLRASQIGMAAESIGTRLPQLLTFAGPLFVAMIAVGGMVHHYLLVGRGPIEFIKNIPNFKNPLPPF